MEEFTKKKDSDKRPGYLHLGLRYMQCFLERLGHCVQLGFPKGAFFHGSLVVRCWLVTILGIQYDRDDHLGIHLKSEICLRLQ